MHSFNPPSQKHTFLTAITGALTSWLHGRVHAQCNRYSVEVTRRRPASQSACLNTEVTRSQLPPHSSGWHMQMGLCTSIRPLDISVSLCITGLEEDLLPASCLWNLKSLSICLCYLIVSDVELLNTLKLKKCWPSVPLEIYKPPALLLYESI